MIPEALRITLRFDVELIVKPLFDAELIASRDGTLISVSASFLYPHEGIQRLHSAQILGVDVTAFVQHKAFKLVAFG